MLLFYITKPAWEPIRNEVSLGKHHESRDLLRNNLNDAKNNYDYVLIDCISEQAKFLHRKSIGTTEQFTTFYADTEQQSPH